MSDKPTPGTVPMTGAYVKQKHRLAAGEKLNGQTLPAAPAQSGPKTPACWRLRTNCSTDSRLSNSNLRLRRSSARSNVTLLSTGTEWAW